MTKAALRLGSEIRAELETQGPAEDDVRPQEVLRSGWVFATLDDLLERGHGLRVRLANRLDVYSRPLREGFGSVSSRTLPTRSGIRRSERPRN